MNYFLIALTLIFTLIANSYYIVTIFRGQTKPHIYSWIIWAIINTIAVSIQLEHNAKWGALTLWVGLIICIIVSIISVWYGEKKITRFDTFSFIITLFIIPLWLVAKQDMIAMMLAIAMDALSFIPTARKSFSKPHEENLLPYFASGTSFFISIFLSQQKSLINILYPIVICGVNFIFIGYIYLRRKTIK